VRPAATKILFLVLDGLGGLPADPDDPLGPTELEAANTPHLDQLAREGTCGLHVPLAEGVAVGSGAGHLALFGYDPLVYNVGRGAISALGLGFDLRPGDLAARGNLCRVDEAGRMLDCRAGRPSTALAEAVCQELASIELPGAELFVRAEKSHRVLVVLRDKAGNALDSRVTSADPEKDGREIPMPRPLVPEARRSADLLTDFLTQVRERLQGQEPANMLTLRGYAGLPDVPSLMATWGLKGFAAPVFPMYSGVAKLLGMDVAEDLDGLDNQVAAVAKGWTGHDFFFLHHKPSDVAGEDGDFAAKVQAIEDLDAQLPKLLDLKPDVVVVTGDHSTPSRLRGHSSHPVPTLLWARTCLPDRATVFGERECMAGGLGPRFPAVSLMPLVLAHAGRLAKFGA
jgi:2,3-bisphosphoglycerate-independent phosphoglycerate mutase